MPKLRLPAKSRVDPPGVEVAPLASLSLGAYPEIPMWFWAVEDKPCAKSQNKRKKKSASKFLGRA